MFSKNKKTIALFISFLFLILGVDFSSARVNGACGPAADKGHYSTPTTGLCSSGYFSYMTGTGHPTWSWDCMGADGGTHKQCSAWGITLEDGKCGSAHGKSFTTKPTTDLCSAGSTSGDPAVSGDGSWTWTCYGLYGGSNVQCTAYKSGTQITECKWVCGNWGSCTNGMQTRICTSSPSGCVGSNPYSTNQSCSDKVNGQCGPSHNQLFNSKPIVGLCNSGTATAVSGTGPWTWVCNGVNGGSDASCKGEKKADCVWSCSNWTSCVNGVQTRTCTSSPVGCEVNPYKTTQSCGGKIDGACGPAHGKDLDIKPNTLDLCSAGYAGPISGTGPWIWKCNGYGGRDVLCSACGRHWVDLKIPGVSDWVQPTYGKGMFLSIANYGNNVYKVITSKDGITWDVSDKVLPIPKKDANQPAWVIGEVVYGNEVFVIINRSTGEYLVSQDGYDWNKYNSFYPFSNNTNIWGKLFYLNDRFIVTTSGFGNPIIVTSTNGYFWENAQVREKYSEFLGNYFIPTGMAYGNGVYVIVSRENGNLLVSHDGKYWEFVQEPQINAWYSVTFGDGIFVAVGSKGRGKIMTSKDGVIWNPVFDYSSGTSQYITYGEGIYLIGGGSGFISYDNAKTWAPIKGNNGASVSYVKDMFFGKRAYLEPCDQSVGKCGIANGKNYNVTPPTSELCEVGDSREFKELADTWSWYCDKGGWQKCSADKSKNVVVGTCGSSHNATLNSIPVSGLCSSGTPTAILGNGPWTWTCKGSDESTSSNCRAEKGQEPCNWSCGSWGNCVGGVQTRICNFYPQGCSTIDSPEIKRACGGVSCGVSHGGIFETKPVNNLCEKGKLLVIAGDGPWYWICQNENNKEDVVLCSANKGISKINGECGYSHKQILAQKPSNELCSKGQSSAVYGNGPWIWLCNGQGGGSLSVCYAIKSEECVGEELSILVSPDSINKKCCSGLVLCPPSSEVVGIHGTCRKSCGEACNDLYDPVCGVDGKTYSNDCYAKKAGVGIAHKGACVIAGKTDCGSANGTSSSAAPKENLCINGTDAYVGVDSYGNWAWKCGDSSCQATDPNREYKKIFAAVEMSKYSGNPFSPDSATVAIQSWHCNWLPSNVTYKDYKKLSCKYEPLGSHGACESCSVVLFEIGKK